MSQVDNCTYNENMKEKEPFYGEILCQCNLLDSKKHCSNKAYWKVKSYFLCGVHSKKYSGTRIELKKDKAKKEESFQKKIEKEKKECDEAACENKKKLLMGKVVCSKLRMMHLPEDIKGFVKVFPNFLHKNRRDGLGLPSLSPKSIGPIEHGQPGLPPAKSLENFHQGNKVFRSEVDKANEPLEVFYKTQLEMYNSDIPQRHKEVALDEKGKRTNVPLYSIWVDKDGKQHKISYFESRQFYCHYYERALLGQLKSQDTLAPASLKGSEESHKDFVMLCNLLKDGYNLQIIGYDGYDVSGLTLEQCYLDCSRPFGHELVLYSMLTCKESEFPWKKYKTFDF